MFFYICLQKKYIMQEPVVMALMKSEGGQAFLGVTCGLRVHLKLGRPAGRCPWNHDGTATRPQAKMDRPAAATASNIHRRLCCAMFVGTAQAGCLSCIAPVHACVHWLIHPSTPTSGLLGCCFCLRVRKRCTWCASNVGGQGKSRRRPGHPLAAYLPLIRGCAQAGS